MNDPAAASASTPVDRPTFGARWWIYQCERFPVFAHGALIAAFSFCAVAFSWMLRGNQGLPPWKSLLVAFCTSFIFFLQLRIADEYKDLEEDTRYRPYRPVPRGLVTLRELRVVFATGCLVQLALALWLSPKLAVLLLIVWMYLAAMSKEFFVGEWLKRRPITYMVSHMIIMPLVDLYATSTDWIVAGLTWPPSGLAWFLAASFFNGMVIEIGRKIRAPADEETGVQTYSAIWGLRRAIGAWCFVLAMTGACAIAAARQIDFAGFVAAVIFCLIAMAIALGVSLLRKPQPQRGKRIEQFSGMWTILLYLALGAAPLIWR